MGCTPQSRARRQDRCHRNCHWSAQPAHPWQERDGSPEEVSCNERPGPAVRHILTIPSHHKQKTPSWRLWRPDSTSGLLSSAFFLQTLQPTAVAIGSTQIFKSFLTQTHHS